MNQIEKLLSKNDVGETGGHQAGILIPKYPPSLRNFFPPLDDSIHNPRAVVDVIDDEGAFWTFSFIYYNGKRTGLSTRDEYRLTGMTPFFRKFNLKVGDTLIFKREGRQTLISYRRSGSTAIQLPSGRTLLKLSSAWTVIGMREE